jgi:hypothetical protein
VFQAFKTWGRFRVMMPTGPRRSLKTNSAMA